MMRGGYGSVTTTVSREDDRTGLAAAQNAQEHWSICRHVIYQWSTRTHTDINVAGEWVRDSDKGTHESADANRFYDSTRLPHFDFDRQRFPSWERESDRDRDSERGRERAEIDREDGREATFIFIGTFSIQTPLAIHTWAFCFWKIWTPFLWSDEHTSIINHQKDRRGQVNMPVCVSMYV